MGRQDGDSHQEEVPEPNPKGGVGFSQTKKTWKAVPAEETAYKRLADTMSSVDVWVGWHLGRQ